MENYIQITKEEYEEYQNLRKYQCIANDEYHKIRCLALKLLIFNNFYYTADFDFNESDLKSLIEDTADELYSCVIEYENSAMLNTPLIKKCDNQYSEAI